jgi:hypothetical protein
MFGHDAGTLLGLERFRPGQSPQRLAQAARPGTRLARTGSILYVPQETMWMS